MFKLSWENFKHHFQSYFPAILVLAMGVSLINMLLYLKQQIDTNFNANIEGIDVVIGAKGSDTQLVLANIYHTDNPTGNISLNDALSYSKQGIVKQAYPLAYGDNYKGFRILGSNIDYIKHYKGEIKKGRYFTSPLEVVIGSHVAEKLNKTVGSLFHSSHGNSNSSSEHNGHVHEESDYKVVGVLKETGTVLDNLCITPISSVWLTHGDNNLKNSFDDASFALAKELNKNLKADPHEGHEHHEGHDEHNDAEHKDHQEKEHLAHDEEHEHHEGHDEHDEAAHEDHQEKKHLEHEEKHAHHKGHEEHEDVGHEDHQEEEHLGHDEERAHHKGHEEHDDAEHKDHLEKEYLAHDEEHAHHEEDDHHNASYRSTNDTTKREITGLLLTYRGSAGFILTGKINRSKEYMAVAPSIVVNKLFSQLGVGLETLKYIGITVLVISILTLTLTLIRVFSQRKYEMALLRVFGTSKGKLTALLIIESLWITIGGFVVGFILSTLMKLVIKGKVDTQYQYKIASEFVSQNELIILFICIICGMVSVILPLIKTYRIDISKTLASEK